MALLIIHHDEVVGLGRLAVPLAERGLDLVHVDATGDELPDPAGHDGVIVLGGRMSVADDDDLPGFVAAELAFLRDADAAEVPVFGICLGSQLLALAHGGRVARRETPEAAFVPVHRTAIGRDDGVAAGWPDGAPGLAHHNDEVVSLPDDAEQLLLGSDGPTMWRIGHAHATQLHPEADADTLARWIDALGPGMLEQAGVDASELIAEARRLDPFTKAAGVPLVLRWVDGL